MSESYQCLKLLGSFPPCLTLVWLSYLCVFSRFFFPWDFSKESRGKMSKKMSN